MFSKNLTSQLLNQKFEYYFIINSVLLNMTSDRCKNVIADFRTFIYYQKIVLVLEQHNVSQFVSFKFQGQSMYVNLKFISSK